MNHVNHLLIFFLCVLFSKNIYSQNLENGLVAYYPFNNNANDESGNNHNGSLIGDPKYIDNRFGQENSAIYFDGAGDYVQVEDHVDLECGNVHSLTAWIKPETRNYNNAVISKYMSDTPSEDGYIVMLSKNHDIRMWVKDGNEGGGEIPWYSNFSFYGQWSFLCFTISEDTLRGYINGKEFSKAYYNHSEFTGNSRNFIIGGSYSGEFQAVSYYSFFKGAIDDVRVYNRTLSDAEIHQLYTENGWDGDNTGNKPQITQQPTNAVKNTGDDVSFTIEAIGDNLSYQWKKDGADISNNSRISGATSNSLSISNLAESDEGSYSCEVFNTEGSVESNAAALTVIDPSALSELQVGGITFYANDISTEDEILYSLSGDVNINNLLYFSGDVQANVNTLSVTGNGQLVIPNVPVIGDYPIYTGGFNFGVEDVELNFFGLDEGGHAVELGKLKVAFEKLSLLENGVELEGEITLSSQLDHATASINKLQITTDGIKLLSTISVRDVAIYHKIKLDTLGLTFNTIDNIYSGSALVKTPLFGIGASAVISEGMLESVGATFQPARPIALGTTGVSISEGYASVEGLKERPISITLGVDLVPTAQGSTDVVKFDNLQIRYEVPKSFYGSGRLLVFDREMASAYISVVPNKISFGGELNVYDILLGKLDAALIIIDDEINIYGYLGATIQWPAGDGFVYDLIEPIMDFPIKIAHTDNYLKNNIFAGNMTIVKLNVNYSLEWIDGELNRHLGRGLENWNEKLFDGSFDDYINNKAYITDPLEGKSYLINRYKGKPALKSTSAGLEQGFVLNTITPNIIVRVMANEDLPQYSVTLPNGVELNNVNGNSFDYSMYVENNEKNMTFYSINNPPLGTYTLNINDNGYDYYVDVVGASTSTSLTMDSLELNGTNVEISWEALSINENEKLSVFYTTEEGASGNLIVQGLDINQENYTWDISGLPTGNYNVFAAIEQEETVSGLVYAPNMLKLIHESAPEAPVELTGFATDTSMVLSWTPGTNETNQYLVYYSEGESPDFDDSRLINVGIDTTFNFTTFNPGNTYYFMVTAVDTATYLESEGSNKLTLAYASTSINNTPNIDSIDVPDYIFANESVSFRVYASDADNDNQNYSLQDAPFGMDITTNGQIDWTPGEDQVGNHYLTVKISDGTDTDTVRLNITVYDKNNPGIHLTPLSSLYSSYCDKGGIIITDPFANKNKSNIDTVEITISAISTDDMLEIKAAESSPNSGVFYALFEFTDESDNQKLEVAASDILNYSYNNGLFNSPFTYASYFMERIHNLTIRQVGEYQEKGDTVLLIAPVDVESYLWSTGEDNDTLIVTTPGDYHVVVSDKCGNIAQSEIITVKNEATAIDPLTLIPFKIAPNPADEALLLYLPEKIQDLKLTITDFSGRIVLQKEVQAQTNSPVKIDVTNLQDGSYIIHFNKNGRFYRELFIITHSK